MHKNLRSLLDHLKEAVASKWDGVIIVDGIEGSGKTVLAMHSALYVDPTINLDRIVFTPEQFFEAVDKASEGQAIIWDEFVTTGLSTDFLDKAQKALIKKMVMIRKKNLYIIWVLPYFFMVGRYFAVARSRFLLHSYTPDGIKRGYWQSWNYDRKRRMYFRGRKEFDYCERPYSEGTFSDFFKEHPLVIDREAYEKKKDEASYMVDKDKKTRVEKQSDKYKNALGKLLKSCRSEKKYTLKELSSITGFSISGVMYYFDEKEAK